VCYAFPTLVTKADRALGPETRNSELVMARRERSSRIYPESAALFFAWIPTCHASWR
jgi:hypothetical protein